MLPDAGVFVSIADAREWVPDPDVPGSEMVELVKIDGLWAGLTRFTTVDGPSSWTPPQRETICVIEGEVHIEIADGTTVHLRPGDVASLPAGQQTTWHISAPFQEMWVFT